jgi:hypothetical protein
MDRICFWLFMAFIAALAVDAVIIIAAMEKLS